METIYKYEIGEKVLLKMAFSRPSFGIDNLNGEVVKITDRKNNKGPCYKLKGYTGWFQETTLFKIKED